MKKNKIIISVSKHEWLDCSTSWFVYINGVKSGGECYSLSEAEGIAESLAKKLGGSYDKNVGSTNEMF